MNMCKHKICNFFTSYFGLKVFVHKSVKRYTYGNHFPKYEDIPKSNDRFYENKIRLNQGNGKERFV